MTFVGEELDHELGKRNGAGEVVVVGEAGGCTWDGVDGVDGVEQEGGWAGVGGGVGEHGVGGNGVVDGVVGAVVRMDANTAAAGSSADPRTGHGHGQP